MNKWNSLLNKSELAESFSGIFNKIGFVIVETGEKFTVSRKVERFTIKEGIEK